MDDLNPGYVLIEVIDGPEGPCLCIGDGEVGYRLAGPKPWGGGLTINRFQVRIAELKREIECVERAGEKE